MRRPHWHRSVDAVAAGALIGVSVAGLVSLLIVFYAIVMRLLPMDDQVQGQSASEFWLILGGALSVGVTLGAVLAGLGALAGFVVHRQRRVGRGGE